MNNTGAIAKIMPEFLVKSGNSGIVRLKAGVEEYGRMIYNEKEGKNEEIVANRGGNYTAVFKKKLWNGIGQNKQQSKVLKSFALAAAFCGCSLGLGGCGSGAGGQASVPSGSETAIEDQNYSSNETFAEAVDINRELDGYEPLKREYNFYFTYKMAHPWWDAVGIGIEDAAGQYEDMGIIINYEYLAPVGVSAQDQIERIQDASTRGFDVIGVDVADVGAVTPVINELIEKGHKVMTFSSSDAAKEDGCKRIAYVGNTHNYEDGAVLTEALCEKLGYKGNVAILAGAKEVPCHEARALGAQEVVAKYPDMKVTEIAYDEDSVEKAYGLAQEFLRHQEELAGIVCCNMNSPVGAARAVIEAGQQGEVVIVGMDHEQESLEHLRDGVIYALGIQDCYSIGFDTVQVAVKIADGQVPGNAYPEKTDEITTVIYQDRAAELLGILYGEID